MTDAIHSTPYYKLAVNHPLISCDDHLDLGQLPADLWSSRLPEHLRAKGPRVEDCDGKLQWVCNGKRWGSWSGGDKGSTAAKPVHTAFDRGGITNLTERRPANPILRLQDMDRDGVYSHVIFGPVTSINTEEDDELRDACYQAYNDWLADFCANDPERLLGVPMLPEFPEAAIAELYRVAAKGVFRQANLQIAVAKPKLHDDRWEPFWHALEETGIILSFHVVVFTPPTNDPARGKVAGVYTHAKTFIEQFIDPFIDLFAWGILERHPRMRLVIAESGVGWLPWLVEELDYRHWRLWEAEDYWAQLGPIPNRMKPSDLFKRQVYATFQESPTAMALLKFYGPDNLLWASDYPHPDSLWPNSRAAIARQMADLDAGTIRKLTYGNAAKLYGLELSAAMSAAAG